MKTTLFFTSLFFTTVSSAQIFFESLASKNFKDMAENGIVYVKSNSERTDSIFEATLTKYWKSTKFEMYDPDVSAPLRETQVILFKSRTTQSEMVVGLAPAKNLVLDSDKLFDNSRMTLYETVGFIFIKGFNQLSNKAANEQFFPYAVSALDGCVNAIIKNDIAVVGSSINPRISTNVLEKSVLLKTKTLLIVGNTGSYIRDQDLDAHGIKYKRATVEEFAEIMAEDRSPYCIFYYTGFDHTNAAIFDLETTELIYTNYFIGLSLKPRFSKMDIGKIVNSWE